MNTDQAKPTKAGIFTSEFWLVVAFTALVQLGPLLTSALESTQFGSIANAVLIAVYAMVRTNAKKVGVVVPMLLMAATCLFFTTSCGLDFSASVVSDDLGLGGTFRRDSEGQGSIELGANVDSIVNQLSGK